MVTPEARAPGTGDRHRGEADRIPDGDQLLDPRGDRGREGADEGIAGACRIDRVDSGRADVGE